MSCLEFSGNVTDKLKQHAKRIRSCAMMATGLPCRNTDPHRFETHATSVAIRPIPERPIPWPPSAGPDGKLTFL